MSTEQVEAALSELARHIEWPPDFQVAVPPLRPERHRVHRRWWPAWVAIGLVLIVVLGLTPAGRQAIASLAEILGIRIEFREVQAAEIGRELSLGRPIDARSAASQVDFELLRPQDLGEADAYYVRDSSPVIQIWAAWLPASDLPEIGDSQVGALLAQFRAVPEEDSIIKLAGAGVEVVRVDIGGNPGFWFEGGPHVVIFDRGDFAEESRLAANVLIWADDGITYRLESLLDLQRALALAEDMVPAGEADPST